MSITEKDYLTVFDTYFRDPKQLVRHQIDSANYFYENDIPEIIEQIIKVDTNLLTSCRRSLKDSTLHEVTQSDPIWIQL